MNIEPLTSEFESAWDDYVLKHTEGALFHRIGWRNLVQRVYRHRPEYWMAIEDGEIVGVLPLFHVKTWLGGYKLVSIPGGVVGGILAENDRYFTALLELARRRAQETGCKYLEMRHQKAVDISWPVQKRHVNVVIPLREEEAHFKALRGDIRRCLRRAFEQDFEIELESDDIQAFFDLYALGQRNFGTPVEGRAWITGVYNAFPEAHRISLIKKNGQVVLAKLMRIYKNEVSPVLSYGLPAFRTQYPEHLLCWEWMKHGHKLGLEYFNFGRSLEGSGPYKFKLGWDGQPQPLHYYYYLREGVELPDFTQTGTRRQKVARLWKKLPLPLANWLGPKVRRSFP